MTEFEIFFVALVSGGTTEVVSGLHPRLRYIGLFFHNAVIASVLFRHRLPKTEEPRGSYHDEESRHNTTQVL